MARVITGFQFWEALAEAGVVDRKKDGHIRRIVIDAEEGGPVKVYIERFADESMLKITTTLAGIKITYLDRDVKESG